MADNKTADLSELVLVDPDDWDEMIMVLTGTTTLGEAERAIAMGPRAWRLEQEGLRNAQ